MMKQEREVYLDGDKVLQGLGHLLSLNVQVTAVGEVVNPLVALVVGLGLSQLVVMVREGEIDSSRVNVHSAAQNLRSHHRALNVPSGTTRTPRRIPSGLARLGSLPESKVHAGLLSR